MYVPRINPISGRTKSQEIAIGLLCGGRLPYDAFERLQRLRHKKRRTTARREKTGRTEHE